MPIVNMRPTYLLFVLLMFCSQTLVNAQNNSRLAMLPGEIRVKEANLIVERQTLIVVPDANYALSANGKVFILPEISAPRSFALPSASSFPLREITIIDKTTGNNRWTVTGGFVTKTNIGLPPFNTENNVEVGKNTRLVLFSDGEKWWDINLGGGAGGGTPLPPQVDAGTDVSLPSTATQVSLTATVTPGNTPIYTTAWEMTRKPAGSTAVIGDPARDQITVTNMTPGNYTFKVTITDDLQLRAIDSVKVYIRYPSQMFSSGGYADNIYDDATGRKAWVYLPDGYNPDEATKYPTVIFLAGNGTNGTDIQQMLLEVEGLPYLLHSKAFPMECVVVMPQLTSGFWSAAEVKKAYDWTIAGYKVDLDRVYLTGLSSGGVGSCEAVYHHPGLFAAYLPIVPVSNILETAGPAVKNIPSMFVQGYQDPYVYITTTIAIANSINSASPKGVYPPLVKTLWFGEHTVDIWNGQVYDKRIAPMDFEKDFFLLHNRNRLQTAKNYVQRAETFNDFNEYAMARKVVDKLNFSPDKPALVTRLDAKLNQLTASDKYYIIDPGVSSYPEVSQTNKVTSAAANTLKENLVDVKGVASAIDFTVVTSSNPTMVDECPPNDYLGFDQTSYRDGLKIEGTGATVKLSSLSPSGSYDIRIFYSNMSSSKTVRTGFRVEANGSSAESIEDGYNTTKYIELYNVRPDAQGEIIAQLTPAFGTYGIMNVILVKEKASAAPVKKVKYNFGTPAASVAGWTAVSGDPVSEVLELHDPSTGWMLSTVNTANWARYHQFPGLSDGGMSTGTFSPEFPADVVRHNFLNYNLKFNGSNYNLEIKKSDGTNLDPGTYQVKIMASIRNAAYNTNDGEYYVKFGGNAVQKQKLNPTENTNIFRTFTGIMAESGTIKISVNRSSGYGSDIAFISGLIVEKVN